MKLFTAAAIATLLASTAHSGPIGGSIELTYGTGGISSPDPGRLNYNGDYFDTFAVKGSVGSSTSGGLGWQLDLDFQTTSFSDVTPTVFTKEDLYTSNGGTVHGNYDLSGFKLGAFVGYGSSTFFDFINETRENYWYGLEASKNLGNFTISAQIGLANCIYTSRVGRDCFNDQAFGGIESRYFIGNNAMITASYTNGNFTSDDNAMKGSILDVSGTMRLGQSDFYSTLGYQNGYFNGFEGTGTEERFYLGVSMLFGGGLREIYAGATPMMSNESRPLFGTYSGAYN